LGWSGRWSLLIRIGTRRRGWLKEPKVSAFVRSHTEFAVFPKKEKEKKKKKCEE